MVDLLVSYAAGGPGHDEMLQATGQARAAWRTLAEQARLGRADRLEATRAAVVELLADQGVTAGDPTAQSWQLDPLPVLVDEHEWHRLEAAVQQRATLLDLVLTDLYRERKLLVSGLLPPEIALAHPGFNRPADGISLPGPHQLFLTATDLARNADGAWTALADRTDVPGGLGYVMADRRVVSEVLATSYRSSRTRRVGPFFQALKAGLGRVAPAAAGDNPRIAMLSSGSSASTFENGYLAAMLGLPIVEGGDLVVRDGRVWARSLGTAEPIDVLLRQVAAADVDPLELRRGSQHGTPGLVHAARRGAVTIVNPLGSGVLENPALHGYLPRLARVLLGEDLALPSAVTYWCGERSMCSHVIANLGRLVLLPVAGSQPAVLGWELSLGQRADLSARISARPGAWVAQEPVEASTTPSVEARTLRPRPTSLRMFAVAADDGYTVLSGGLGHVGDPPQAMLGRPTMGTAKDVWVLAAEPPSISAGPADGLARQHPGDAVSPRAAERLYQFGRRTEAAEATARLLGAVADRWDDYHARLDADGVRALSVLCGALPTIDDPELTEATLTALITDVGTRGSVAWWVARMHRAATGVRDNLSTGVWVALSSLERTLEQERHRLRGDADAQLGLGPVLSRVLESLTALGGICADSLVRDTGWHLLQVGRRLERAERLVATLAATLTARPEPAVEALVVDSVLVANESII
ncbi:MAG: circularly permuted type 2 ATP-grasp protein, partial [Georgenia sp.]